MRLDFLTVTGSPRGISGNDVYGRGIGGAELFLIKLSELLSQHGYEVNIYNDPPTPCFYNGVNYLPNYAFDPEIKNRIIFMFRGYDARVVTSKKIKTIGISTDQFTTGQYQNDFYPYSDIMVGISEFHRKDHFQRYGKVAEKMKVLDIGIDENEYRFDVEKEEYKTIFCSVPDRGLAYLLDYWPDIKRRIPQLKLEIYSDYRLWGNPTPDNGAYREKAKGLQDINFKGKTGRWEMIRGQLESEAQLYPCVYDENFCISVAENQMAGNYCITSNVGALQTTNFTTGRIDLDPKTVGRFKGIFIERLAEYFSKPFGERKKIQKEIKQKAFSRFSWEHILPEWIKLINE